MQTPVVATLPDAPRRIHAALSIGAESHWTAEAANYLRSQLELAAARPPSLPQRYDELAAWITHDAQTAADAYHRYQVAREYGAPRRHFANSAQARQFLREASPARLADGASLYGVVERWDDTDFQPMIASYLEQLGNGVPDRNRYLLYRDLLAGQAAGTVAGELEPERYRSAAVELALAHGGENFLPELIGYNLARQQPSSELLVARHELTELSLNADAFAAAGVAAGSGPSALLTLRGVMTRVGDPAAFYRRVADGYRLHVALAHLPLPTATPGAQQPGVAQGSVAAGHDTDGDDSREERQQDSATARRGTHTYPALAPASAAAAATAATAAAARSSAASLRGDTAAQHARPRGERPVIRHHFPADEHAWEAIGCELRLLEARLAASDSKEEAMSTLARLLAPAQQHTPAGLMAARIYSQLFNL
jgi:hypothetical protein